MIRQVAAALLIGMAAPGLAASAAQARLLGPTDGPIQEVLLVVPPDDVEPDGRLGRLAAETLAGVAGALGPDVRYLVHGYAEHRTAITRTLEAAGARKIRFVPSAFGQYTRWVQDVFLVEQTREGPRWALPPEMPRRLDASVGSEVARLLGRPTRELPVAVQGGNVVPFGGWVFAGKDLLLDGAGRLGDRRRATIEQAVAPDDRWIWIGTQRPSRADESWRGHYQPLFHLDLFLTAVGPEAGRRPRVLVGSPRLARQLLGMPALAEDEDSVYDGIAQALQADGFKVVRLPLLIERAGTDTAVIGYHNVLLAHEGSRRVVYLPRYRQKDARLERLDRYAGRAYERLGYAVRWVAGPFPELAWQFGSLRCLLQVTARGPINRPAKQKGGD